MVGTQVPIVIIIKAVQTRPSSSQCRKLGFAEDSNKCTSYGKSEGRPECRNRDKNGGRHGNKVELVHL